MESHDIQLLKNHFDGLSHIIPEEGVEFWFARDLMEPLGYARWKNFKTEEKNSSNRPENSPPPTNALLEAACPAIIVLQ